MSGEALHSEQIVLLVLLLFVVGFAVLARKLTTPYPIVLVVGGLLLGFLPGIPRVRLDPEVIFLLVLPPLLYAAAWVTSWKEFCHNFVTIAFLAVGLVGFTVAGVALAGPLLLPGFDWRLGFVLGAVVATTDSIAATSIAKRVRLPKRLVDILEGESLVNDATGLLALEFAIAIVVHNQTPTVGSAVLRLIYLSVAGVAVGLVLARIVEWFEDRIDDGPIEIAVSILVPYTAYLAAEVAHASGVLAVVAAGLYLGRRSSRFFSPGVRLQANAVWDALTFIVNGFVFLLIGLQLPYVLSGIRELKPAELVMYGGLFSALLILLRMIWVLPGAYVSFWIRRRLLHQRERRPGVRQVFVVSWTGMRGVIALAAALSLPRTLADGSPFPQRNLIVFLTFSVILVTLVFQGLALPLLIRKLKLVEPPGPPCEEREARRLMVEGALAHLEGLREKDDEDLASMYEDLAHHYEHRMASLQPADEKGAVTRRHYARYLDVSSELLEDERRTAIGLRNAGRISDEVLRVIEQEIDLSALRLRGAVETEASFRNIT